MTNNTLQNLQKEAREEWKDSFMNTGCLPMIDQLVAHVFTRAIEQARKIVRDKENPYDSLDSEWYEGAEKMRVVITDALKALLDK